jgi:hypothetical protein
VISLLSTGVGLLLLVLFLPGGLIRPMVSMRDRLARLLTGIDPREVIAVHPTSRESLDTAVDKLAPTPAVGLSA